MGIGTYAAPLETMPRDSATFSKSGCDDEVLAEGTSSRGNTCGKLTRPLLACLMQATRNLTWSELSILDIVKIVAEKGKQSVMIG